MNNNNRTKITLLVVTGIVLLLVCGFLYWRGENDLISLTARAQEQKIKNERMSNELIINEEKKESLVNQIEIAKGKVNNKELELWKELREIIKE